MPTFLGALRPAADQAGLSKLLHGTDGVAPAPATSGSDETKEKQLPATAGKEAIPLAPGEEWTPSGGKKLSTGLAICLENSASGCQKPCVLDIKLGARLWDDDAPLAKRQKLDEVANTSTSGSLGWRVAGMKVYVGGRDDGLKLRPEEEGFVSVQEKEGYKSYDKFYGRQFKGKEDVVKAFEAYLPPKASRYREEVGKRFIRELESVEYVLENTESRMYSASLLFVYEGDEEALSKALEYEKKQEEDEDGDEGEGEGEDQEGADDGPLDENDEEIEPKVHDLKLIDFAHARWTKGEGRDENALRGVRSCLELLKAVVAK